MPLNNRQDIAEGLLRMLSLVLMHQPLRHPGMPRHAGMALTGPLTSLASPSPSQLDAGLLASLHLGAGDEVASTVLALRTLGNFDFQVRWPTGTGASLTWSVFDVLEWAVDRASLC